LAEAYRLFFSRGNYSIHFAEEQAIILPTLEATIGKLNEAKLGNVAGPIESHKE
jgi:hypothetical protein